MATTSPPQRDRERTRARLQDWFAAHLGVSEVEVGLAEGPEGTGFSSETLMVDVRWRGSGDDGDDTFVIRTAPVDESLFVFEHYEIPLQYHVQRALAERTDIPVAPLHALEEDPDVLGGPFYVMSKVEGRVPRDHLPYTMEGWLLETSPEQQSRLYWGALDVLARIARVDVHELGLHPLLAERERWPGGPGVESQIAYLERYLDWATRDVRNPVAEAGLEWLRENKPDDDDLLGLSWGDSRIGNMIFDDQMRCAAVLDWEMVSLANPEMDLAWWLFLQEHHSAALGVPDLPGFPARDEVVARWEELVGRPARHVDFYWTFAGVHFAVVMMRVSRARGALGDEIAAAMEIDNIPTQMLGRALERA